MGDNFVREVEWLEPSPEALWGALEAVRLKAEEANASLGVEATPWNAARFEATTEDWNTLERASVEELREALAQHSMEAKTVDLRVGDHEVLSWSATARIGGFSCVMDVRLSGPDRVRVDAAHADLDRWWRVARAAAREVPDDWGFTPVEGWELVRSDPLQKARPSKWRAFWTNNWVVGIGVTVVGGLILTGILTLL